MIKRIGLHILFWLAILYWRANGDYFSKAPFEKFILQNLVRLPAMIVATYGVAYYLLPQFIIKEKRYFTFTFWLGVVLFVATYIDNLLIKSAFMKMVLHLETEEQYKWLTNLHPYRNSFLLIAIIGMVSLIRFFKIYQQQEQKKNQLIQEKLETQYAFLKAQVNPHFLFNALNNIYSMAVQQEQKEIAMGLENLSSIMHYLTYESIAKQVALKKEIDLLKNYIDIEYLRISETDDTTISFNIEGVIADKMIAPVILLPLVENAFKHGVKPDQKCLVSIKLIVKENTVQFTIKNTFFEFGEKEIKEQGIGLENVRKRLELRYPAQHSLKVEKVADYFHTDLIINL